MPWRAQMGPLSLAMITLYPKDLGADPETSVSSHCWETSRRKEEPEPLCPIALISI